MQNKPKIVLVYVLTFTGILVWLGAIVLAPYLRSRESAIAPFFYACFSPICHQIPSRSFFFFGFPMAVCARCLGIYTGFFGGMFLYLLKRRFSSIRLPGTIFFLAVSAPIVLDTAGNILHFWSTSNTVRFGTGFLWGLILPFYFMTGICELFIYKKRVK